jgi:hypothetical protein
MEEAARAVVESGTPLATGDYLVPGWAFERLWLVLGEAKGGRPTPPHPPPHPAREVIPRTEPRQG